MSLLLTLEHGPRNQAVRQSRLDTGELVIGRSAEADWQIEDPDMYVSRAHCTVSARADGYFVTDTSSSGLFINDSATPLGAGNSTRLQSGMRLRLGDYVVGIELEAAQRSAQAAPDPFEDGSPKSRTPARFGNDDFFAVKTEEVPPTPRPAGLPDPFEKQRPSSLQAFERSDADRHNSPAFDDPFSLEPVATPEDLKPRDRGNDLGDPFGFGLPDAPPLQRPAQTAATPPLSFNDDFSESTTERKTPVAPPPVEAPAKMASPAKRARAPWEIPSTNDDVPEPVVRPEPPAPPVRPTPPPVPPPVLAEAPRVEVRPMPSARETPEPPRRNVGASATSDDDLYAAFMRGLGAEGGTPNAAEMEKLGREYRLMLEGLMQLLRKRAEEKGNARVAQTVVGASDVNPLKFMPTVDDALSILMRGQSPGFLGGEAAIADSVRDLASHHVRAWRGVQGALRRMIDRFDPTAIEEELKSSSGLGTILTGGKSAKLWELYRKRHREIAQSAETRFLGEIGADFRDAYEEE